MKKTLMLATVVPLCLLLAAIAAWVAGSCDTTTEHER